MSTSSRRRRSPLAAPVALAVGLLVMAGTALLTSAAPAGAQVAAPVPTTLVGQDDAVVILGPTPSAPESVPTPGAPSNDDRVTIGVDLPGQQSKASESILVIIMLTLLSLAPAALILLSGFTRIVIVLSLTRNALGLQSIPPNIVITGLSLFLALFVMAPTVSKVNETALQPLLKGDITEQQAYHAAEAPVKAFMLRQTRTDELNTMISLEEGQKPATPQDVTMSTLVPAFLLSELKTAFIIGFAIFIPFLIIDLVVSTTLMSMGMMMLPPSLVSLPFKLLLFVLVDGWALITTSLITSFH